VLVADVPPNMRIHLTNGPGGVARRWCAVVMRLPALSKTIYYPRNEGSSMMLGARRLTAVLGG